MSPRDAITQELLNRVRQLTMTQHPSFIVDRLMCQVASQLLQARQLDMPTDPPIDQSDLPTGDTIVESIPNPEDASMIPEGLGNVPINLPPEMVPPSAPPTDQQAADHSPNPFREPLMSPPSADSVPVLHAESPEQSLYPKAVPSTTSPFYAMVKSFPAATPSNITIPIFNITSFKSLRLPPEQGTLRLQTSHCLFPCNDWLTHSRVLLFE